MRTVHRVCKRGLKHNQSERSVLDAQPSKVAVPELASIGGLTPRQQLIIMQQMPRRALQRSLKKSTTRLPAVKPVNRKKTRRRTSPAATGPCKSLHTQEVAAHKHLYFATAGAGQGACLGHQGFG